MSRKLVFAMAFVSAILMSFASLASAGTHPQDHTGWSIGFGVGGGSAGLDIDGIGTSDREGGGLGNFRLGYALNPQLSLAFEGSAWSKSENGTTVTFGASTLGVAFFPSEGLVLRAGAGLGTTTVSSSSGSTTLTASESGFGLHGGIGYDFRVARTFAIGPQFDYGYATFDGGSSNWFGVGLNFNWYFIANQ